MVIGAAVAALGLIPARANAALLTLLDGTDVWTLDVQTGCTVCDITLSVTYASSARTGDFLGAVQWDLTDPNVNPTDIGFASTNTGGTWVFSFNGVNNAGGDASCGAGDPNAVCGVESNAPSGGGLLVADGTYNWIFHSTFASPLVDLKAGNIRAGYNVDPDGNGPLATIFSPGGGNFGGGGSSGGGGSTVPEPASLLLFGVGAVATAYRARRRAAR